MPDLSRERRLARQHGGLVAGVDEVGRGALAGPVVTAAVALNPDAFPDSLLESLDDSKRLTARAREALAPRLRMAAAGWALGAASAREVDRLNVRAATMLAMRRAVARLSRTVDARAALVDGRDDPGLHLPARMVVGGDGLCASIAAASVLAKVARDGLMARLDAIHPGYGWARNMGYGVKAHRDAIARLGPAPHHRRAFAPVRHMHAARGP